MTQLINSIEQEKISKKLKQDLILRCLVKYKDYHKYLTEDFFKQELEKFIKLYNEEFGISIEVYFQIFINKKALSELSRYIRNGDIDLEIELIDKYNSLLKYILTKMNMTNEYLSVDTDKILMKSLESYDGDKPFPLHILDNVKQLLNANFMEQADENISYSCETKAKQILLHDNCSKKIDLKISKGDKERGVKMPNKDRSRNDDGTKKYFFEYFNYYSKEKVMASIDRLPEIYQKLLRRAYGDDYEQPLADCVSRYDQMLIRTNIVIKIREILQYMPKTKKHYLKKDNFNNDTKDFENAEKNTSNNNDTKIVEGIEKSTLNTKVSDITMNQDVSINQDDSKNNINEEIIEQSQPFTNKSIINYDNDTIEYCPHDVKLSVHPDFVKTKDEEISQIFNNPVLIEIARNKSLKSFLITALRLGYINGKYFKSKDIAIFLGIDEKEVNNIFKSTLLEYKTKLDDVISQVIELDTVPSMLNKKYIKLPKSNLQDK